MLIHPKAEAISISFTLFKLQRHPQLLLSSRLFSFISLLTLLIAWIILFIPFYICNWSLVQSIKWYKMNLIYSLLSIFCAVSWISFVSFFCSPLHFLWFLMRQKFVYFLYFILFEVITVGPQSCKFVPWLIYQCLNKVKCFFFL